MIQTTRRQFVGITLTLATFLITPAPTFGQETTTAPLKVLFIGNSYTFVNDLPAMIAGLADVAGGPKIEVDRHLVGGCTLERHVKERKAIDKIRAAKWDVVVLQEQSLRPIIDRKSMHEYARLLDAEIKQQGAKTVFYLTWARQHIPEMQKGADPAESPEYAEAMYEISGAGKATDLETWCQQQEIGLIGGLNGGYLDIAKELEAGVAPVGIAWKMALAADPPFVLHRPDKSHPNPTGTYLAACVFYATLLDANPVGLPGKIQQGDKVLADFPDDQAERLQEIAWVAVRKLPRGEATSTNPVGITPIHMGDPFVIQHERSYCVFGTNASNEGFKCWQSTDLVHWTEQVYSFGIMYGVALADDLSRPIGEPVKLMETDQPWEKVRYAENRCHEGAFVLKHGQSRRSGWAMAAWDLRRQACIRS